MSRLRQYNLPRQRTNIWVQRYAAYITQPFDQKNPVFYLNLLQGRNVLFQMFIKNVISSVNQSTHVSINEEWSYNRVNKSITNKNAIQ